MEDAKQHISDHEAVRKYLEKLERQLGKMPAVERSRIHQEFKEHLDQIVAARLAGGSSRQAATETAIRQLGDPAEIGRRMLREWALSGPDGTSLWSVAEAYAWCFALLSLAGFVAAKFFSPHHDDINNHNALLLLLAPLATGAVMGIRSSKQAIPSVVYSLAAWFTLFVAVWLGEQVWLRFVPGGHEFFTLDIGKVPVLSPLLGLAAFALVFAVLIGLAIVPAYLVSAWMRREFYKPTLGSFRLRKRIARN